MKQTILSAEEMVLRYHKECKSVQRLRWVTLAMYLVLLFLTASSMTLTRTVIYVVIFLSAMWMLRSMEKQQFVILQQVLSQQCDALKYTEIMKRMLEKPDKGETSIRLCYAKGLYFSGRFEEAQQMLQTFYLQRPSVATALMYRNIMFSCCLELEDAEGARREREEVAQLLGRVKPKEQVLVRRQLEIMDASLALLEERYDDFFPLQGNVLRAAELPLQRVSAAYRLALGKLVVGEDAEARELLQQVTEEGGTLFMTAEAMNLLEEYALPEAACVEDEE